MKTANESSRPRYEEPAMTTKPEQLVKTMKGMRSVRAAGPEERLFGGKGILVRYKPNLTDDSPEKSARDPDLTERQNLDDSENPDAEGE